MAFRSNDYGLDGGTINGGWRSRSACSQDPELFFPVGDSGAAFVQAQEAVAVCLTVCPVLDECREWLRDHPLEYGVVAGMTEDQRRHGRVRPHKPIQTHRTCCRCETRFEVTRATVFAKICEACATAGKAVNA